jgi:hypothetical protein
MKKLLAYKNYWIQNLIAQKNYLNYFFKKLVRFKILLNEINIFT